ncbi:MAG: diacylglycerol kinase family protein [Solobacterium sp.]|nr:diacylglycerol kinase family protein [Solobacterium sp.]
MKKKFKPAIDGFLLGFKHPAVLLQFVLGAMAVAAGFILKLDLYEWLAVIICIGLVITAEMLNTCIEKICDMYTTEYNEKIKIIKDISAGAVLTASLTALTAAAVIFIRHLI